MDQPDRRDEEVSALRERLARLGEASLRINESLDFNTVLAGASWTRPASLTRSPLRGGDRCSTIRSDKRRTSLSSGLTP